MSRSLPTLEQDGFCLHPAGNPAQGAAPGALCCLLFEIGFLDQNDHPFTHHQSLWVVVTAQHADHWLGTLLEAPFLFIHDEQDVLAIGTELPFLPCHIAGVLHAADLGPAERAVASRPPHRRWAA